MEKEEYVHSTQAGHMKIIAIHVGSVETCHYQDKKVLTAALKHPVEFAQLTLSGFEGDEQADRVHHGGADKAVCVYAADHYAFWERIWGRPPGMCAFGENLTLTGALEEAICIGDIFRVGGATVQVTQPRQPCSKLAARHN